MKLNTLFDEDEISSIKSALDLTLGEDPILPHWEFHTLTGVSVAEGLSVLEQWPNIDVDSDPEWFLLYGILGRYSGYPHKQEDRIRRETGLQKVDLRAFMERLKPFEPQQ